MKRSPVLSKSSEKSDFIVDDKGMLTGLDGSPVEIAQSIVGYSLLVRRNEQSFSWTSLGYLVLIVLIFGWWFWRVGVRVTKSEQKLEARQTAVASGNYTIGVDGIMRTMTPITDANILASTFVAEYMLSATPTFTPLPTSTMTPLPTATKQPEMLMFKLTFYDPEIGRYFPDNPKVGYMNCAVWDEVSLKCLSTMADGTPFYDEYGKAVACPPPLQNGDILRVVYPEQLAGDWTCRDRGWAIENGYLDFLLRYPDMVWTGYDLNNFPWWSTVQAYHIHP